MLTTDWASVPAVDIISGGFPCQPFSTAGKRKGNQDDRYLWPAMLAVIQAVRPTWVVGENVAGIISMELDNAIADLENSGYEVQTLLIPALAVGAQHRRLRVWIIAHSCSQGPQRSQFSGAPKQRIAPPRPITQCYSDVGHANCEVSTPKPKIFPQPKYEFKRSDRFIPSWHEHWLEVAARTCRVDDGLPRRVDRAKRIKALGNSIVPQIAFEIFSAINLTYEQE